MAANRKRKAKPNLVTDVRASVKIIFIHLFVFFMQLSLHSHSSQPGLNRQAVLQRYKGLKATIKKKQCCI